MNLINKRAAGESSNGGASQFGVSYDASLILPESGVNQSNLLLRNDDVFNGYLSFSNYNTNSVIRYESKIMEMNSNPGQNFVRTHINTNQANHYKIVFDNTEAVRVTSTGNVGIGTASPQAKLSMRTSSSTQGLIIGNVDNTGVQSHFGLTTADQPKIGLATESFLNYYNDGKWSLNSGNTTGTTLPISFNTDGQSRIYIKPDGNVGIGTTTPDSRLAVNGNISLTGYGSLSSNRSPNNSYTNLFVGGGIVDQANGTYKVITDGGTNFFAGIKMDNSGGNAGSIKFYSGLSTGGSSYVLSNTDLENYARMTIVNGNVGIGTTTPSFKFHIRGGNPNSDLMTLGVATTGNFALTSADGGAYGLFGGVSNTGRAWLQAGRYDTNTAYDLTLQTAGGNVGIGTTAPDAKLTVKGNIHTNEVKVDLLGAVAPDYVFEKEYDLMSLEDTKAYIDANKHLPEVPSAKEMEKNGVQLGEMNLLLLKKVEELTLHLIELKKQNEELKNRVEKIENKK